MDVAALLSDLVSRIPPPARLAGADAAVFLAGDRVWLERGGAR